MYGLDQNFVDTIDFESSLKRVKTNVATDFILAPHYSVVFEHAASELITYVKDVLKQGKYTPLLPIKTDVPKRSGLTRPGAILVPVDRLVYQALADLISSQVESNLDRSIVFSHVLITNDSDYKMFKSNGECWKNMESTRNSLCNNNSFKYVIQADIANYFERLYQHNLINLLRSCNCDSRAVNLLEKVLLEFTEKDSHGILQGLFPSDLFGNFYLSSLDSYLKIQDIPFVRYVDDLYLFFKSEIKAKKGLVDLCRFLRDEGLNLNETKTKIKPSKQLYRKENLIDRLFQKAKEEIGKSNIQIEVESIYGFQTIWAKAGDVYPTEEIELQAVRKLYNFNTTDLEEREKVDRFCLPYLTKASDDIAIEDSLQKLVKYPYLAHIYSNYLRPFALKNVSISKQIETIINDVDLPYDWSLMWMIAVLVEAESVSEGSVNNAFKIVVDSRRSEALRGICTYLVAKHGNAGQRRILKYRYDQEPSQYVKEAILFSSKYFPINERNSCLGAWGSHSVTNSLIAKAIRVSNP